MHKGAGRRVTQATPRATGRLVEGGDTRRKGNRPETRLERRECTETRPRLIENGKIIGTRHGQIFGFSFRPTCRQPAVSNQNTSRRRAS